MTQNYLGIGRIVFVMFVERVGDVDFPGGDGVGSFVGGIAAPQRLDEQRRRRNLTIEMLLTLLLLNL